jgi:hypothetical protein
MTKGPRTLKYQGEVYVSISDTVEMLHECKHDTHSRFNTAVDWFVRQLYGLRRAALKKLEEQ